MKDPNGFDELARQKLAERDHAFDPAHWTDMQRLLAERERKPNVWWPWMAAGVLLLGGATLWSVADEEIASSPSPTVAVVEEVERSTKTSENTATAQVSSSTQASSEAHAQTLRPEATPKKEELGHQLPAGEAKGLRLPAGDQQGHTLLAGEAKDHHMDVVILPSTTVKPEKEPSTKATISDTTEPDRTSELKDAESGIEPTASGSETSWIINTVNKDLVEPRIDTEIAIVQESDAPPIEPAVENPAEPSTATAEPTAPGPGAPAPAVVEPSIAPVAPPEWLAVRRPFELSLLGGGFSTTSDYRGSGTETWKASTERQNTLGVGIEGVWNIGRYFALGIGAHHSSYKERLIAEELSRTDELRTNSYFWMPFDTIVLTVVDTVTIGATEYFVSELVPITINVLGIDTDTSYNTTVLRQRRSSTNTVHYIEFPLLLDAHTSCGRWVFGLRGGPTVGLLTSKQGMIPSASETGYSDLDERTFSTLNIGATARAYARYRLCSAWSIGVEPTWRQQLGNAFADPDVQRRGAAFGGYLSLSYRFAPKSIVP